MGGGVKKKIGISIVLNNLHAFAIIHKNKNLNDHSNRVECGIGFVIWLNVAHVSINERDFVLQLSRTLCFFLIKFPKPTRFDGTSPPPPTTITTWSITAIEGVSTMCAFSDLGRALCSSDIFDTLWT